MVLIGNSLLQCALLAVVGKVDVTLGHVTVMLVFWEEIVHTVCVTRESVYTYTT